jgi:hypothetical protein
MPADTAMHPSPARRIGSIGTGCRVALGLVLLTLAFLDKPAGVIGGLELHDLVLGLVVFPAASVVVGVLAGRYHDGPLRFTGTAGTAANLAVIIVLFAVPYTAGAAALFYGLTLLIAAWRGDPGCEATLVSNVLLKRDDQVGCPCLTPIDTLESRR